MNIFEVLEDETRRGMLEQLANGPLPAGDLGSDRGISQPALARHLRVLRNAGLVEATRIRKDGRIRLYRLRPDPLDEVRAWLAQFWRGQLEAYAAYVRESS
jgi:DNA-binding transcriptional ArsR family regulator